jgi:hypothetical protein
MKQCIAQANLAFTSPTSSQRVTSSSPLLNAYISPSRRMKLRFGSSDARLMAGFPIGYETTQLILTA